MHADCHCRPELTRLRLALTDGAFDVVAMRDTTRLGGEMTRTQFVMLEITERAQLWTYDDGGRVELDSPTEKFLQAAMTLAAETEVEKLRGRVAEKGRHLARTGANPGGRTFGYRNVVREDGTKDLEFDEAEAEVVRRIFREYADGAGYASIARKLNADQIPPPRAGERGSGSWSPTQIRSMLGTERYRGRLVYGRSSKGYRGGRKVRERAPRSTHIVTERIDHRIVSPELWRKVEARREANRKRYGGTEAPKHHHRHLLTGHAICGECGGPMQVERARWGTETGVRLYACALHRKRGKTVCGNTLRKPADEVEGKVAAWIQDHVLREDLVIEIVRESQRLLERKAKGAGPRLARLIWNDPLSRL